MKNTLLIICLIFIVKLCTAQTATISGFITDYETGEYLIGAGLFETGTNKGTTTNNNGFYSLRVKTGSSVEIKASYIGYNFQKREFVLSKDTIINFSLRNSTTLETITVYAEKNIHTRPNISSLEISLDEIKRMPSLSGETDLLKVFQLMPGVQSGREGSSALSVRGGSSDQNLYLVDNVPLYYVNHLGGFVSVFDNNAVNSMLLMKGGFPARYGGRLSSIIDMQMKKGNMNKICGELKFGLLSSKIFAEGPIKKGKTSFMLSVRRSNIDLVSRTIAKLNYDGFSAAYTFYDIYGKIHHKFSDKNSVFLSFYSGRDRVSIKDKGEPFEDPRALDDVVKYNYESALYMKWGNQMATARWNHLWSNKLFSNLSLAYSHFYYNTEKEYIKKEDASGIILEKTQNIYQSGIKDLTGRLDFDYYPSSSQKIKFGIHSIKHEFNPGMAILREQDESTFFDTAFSNTTDRPFEINAYAEDEIKFWDKASCNIGTRASYYNTKGQVYMSLQARATINWQISDNFSIKTAYSRIQQNIHRLTESVTGIPADIWLPASESLKPQSSDQYVINLTQSFAKYKIETSLEGFYKEMYNLTDFEEGASYQINTANWMNIIETGGFGRVYGIELLIQKKIGKTTGWLAYTLSKSERKFKNINDGVFYPSANDRRHDLAIVIIHRFNKRISISANWVFSSGNMMTLAVQTYNSFVIEPHETDSPTYEEIIGINSVTSYYYGSKNNFRLPSYHRLDLSLNITKKKKRGEQCWQFGLYNAYCQSNIFFLYYEGNDLYKFTLFPIIPSISYSFKF